MNLEMLFVLLPKHAKRSHLAFGSGARYCLGAWYARALVAAAALANLFRRLHGLRLSKGRLCIPRALNLQVEWET